MEHVLFTPAGWQPFIFHPELRRLLVLEQCESRPPEDAEVGVGVALPDAAMVFAKRDVQLPVQFVFDGPMTLHDRCELFRRQLLAQDVVPNVDALLSVTNGVADDHADRLESRPSVTIRQIARDRADIVPAGLFAAMGLVHGVPLPTGVA